MGNFRSGGRGFGGRDRDSGRDRDRGRSRGGRDRFDRSERSDRRPREMVDAICSSCGKHCKLPFKPTGSKPVFCSDCFEKEGTNSRNNNSTNMSSSKDLKEINAKLDKIIYILNQLEIIEDEEEAGDEEIEEEDEEDDDVEDEDEDDDDEEEDEDESVEK